MRQAENREEGQPLETVFNALAANCEDRSNLDGRRTAKTAIVIIYDPISSWGASSVCTPGDDGVFKVDAARAAEVETLHEFVSLIVRSFHRQLTSKSWY